MRVTDYEAISAVEQLARDYGLVIEGILRPVEAPELVVKSGWARCAHCGSYEIVERDMGQRENDIEVDETGRSIVVSQAQRDFHTITWLCQSCGQRHDLPEGVEVDYP